MLRGRTSSDFAPIGSYIEFRIAYQHKLCLLGKQQGPLIYTVTLLPGEKVTLYHSDRYRRIISETDRFPVQTTFMQLYRGIRAGASDQDTDRCADRVATKKGTSSVSVGGGLGRLTGDFPVAAPRSKPASPITTWLRVGLVSDES